MNLLKYEIMHGVWDISWNYPEIKAYKISTPFFQFEPLCEQLSDKKSLSENKTFWDQQHLEPADYREC